MENNNKTIVDISESKILESQLVEFAEWFNVNQWRGGKGDRVKVLFCKCDYKGIVEEYLKQKEND